MTDDNDNDLIATKAMDRAWATVPQLGLLVAPLVLASNLLGCTVGDVTAGIDAAAPPPDGDPAKPGDAKPPLTDPVTVLWLGTGEYNPAAEGRIVPHTLNGSQITAKAPAKAGSLPSWMALAPDGAHLYALDENNSRVLAFSVTPGTGALTEIDSAPSGGTAPVHVAVDRTGKWLLVAHYTSGDVSVLAIENGGTLADTPSDVEPVGKKAHQVVIDPKNQFVFVPCVEDNHVAQLTFDPAKGTLERNDPAVVSSEDGAGPRHLVFHPDGAHAYVVNETNSKVTAYGYDAAKGLLTRADSVSMLPDDLTGQSFGGEIAITADGRFVYASNRGHDSIAVFAVDPSGTVTPVARTPSGGTVPRSFLITPAGDRLIVANQTSNNVVSFAIDRAEGTLSDPTAPLDTGAAAFFIGAFTIPAQ